MSLHEIQTKVHVAKDKRNDFGGYNYRTAEGILSALKAALPEGWSVVVSDEIGECAGQIFVTAEARISDGTNIVASAKGHAMHPLQKKGMDPSQITGAASSYARKYALAGLLALDDGSVDPDRTNTHDDTPKNVTAEALLDAWEQGIMDMLPDDPSPETLAEAYADAMSSEVEAYKSARGVENYMRKHAKHLDFIKEYAPERHGPLRADAWGHMQRLDGKAA